MRVIGFLTGATLSAAAASPTAAQTVPMDMILPPAYAHAPATTSSTAQGFNLSAAPLATTAFHPRRTSAPATHDAVTAATQAVADKAALADKVASTAPVPLPPVATAKNPAKRTEQDKATLAQMAASEPISIAPRPVVTAAAGPAAVARVEQLSNSAIIERANSYFTNLTTLVADFTQIGGDGRRIGGTLYLHRPGKIRFEYDPPATLEVIADGTSVAVRDKKLLTQDMYFIQQTPLKFLLRERVNLGQDIAVTGISSDANSVRVNLEDSSTLGGTSRIALYFDPEVKNLTQWRIVDPQGYQTVVTLNKVDRTKAIDQSLFRIPNAPSIGNNR